MAAECKRIESAQHALQARQSESAQHLRQAQVLKEERAGRMLQAHKCRAEEAAGGAKRKQPAARLVPVTADGTDTLDASKQRLVKRFACAACTQTLLF